MKTTMEHKETYIIKEITEEAPDVKTLKLTLLNGSLPTYIAGQFITVYFPESQTLEGKAYTLSSAPYESTCNITVKKMGEFSGRLCSMEKGDTITASLPYGFFSSEYPDMELIALAGGIGVAPFRSIILETLLKHPGRKVCLFYSSTKSADIIFKNEFNALSKACRNFSISYHITQEKKTSEAFVKGRIHPKEVVTSLSKDQNKEFLICGSISFVKDMWKGLREQGVPEHHIYTEAFFR
jgi:ferredoxin-NADP reductase